MRRLAATMQNHYRLAPRHFSAYQEAVMYRWYDSSLSLRLNIQILPLGWRCCLSNEQLQMIRGGGGKRSTLRVIHVKWQETLANFECITDDKTENRTNNNAMLHIIY